MKPVVAYTVTEESYYTSEESDDVAPLSSDSSEFIEML